VSRFQGLRSVDRATGAVLGSRDVQWAALDRGIASGPATCWAVSSGSLRSTRTAMVSASCSGTTCE